MLISYLWLRELVDFDLTPEELAARLTTLGLETSIKDDRRGWHKNIFVGKVLEVAPHPNADKLRLTRVDVGGAIKNIVCGAPNVAVGQFVPVALEGATLPDGLEIKNRKVRGELSEGMICSESELKISEDHDGIMALEGDNLAPGQLFADMFEVTDTLLEVDLTPNRGDCLSMLGIAREVAAAVGSSVKLPVHKMDEIDETSASRIDIQIDAPDLCPRYTGRVIADITVKPAPFWMRRRLMALGVRTINNMVDITNYVMLETGQPLHAFDYHNIAGQKIIVCRAGAGEEFVTLDGKSHTLSADNLVIADAERAVALAGVMGGQNSEVSDVTKWVMLESAFFDPKSTRRTGKTLGISTEASYRFERGVDIENTAYAQDRAAYLMARFGCGKLLKDMVDAYPVPVKRRNVSMRFARVNKILGIDVSQETSVGILKSLEMEVETLDADSVTVSVPHSRHDMEREIDLIEEVARHVGYDKLVSSIPRISVKDIGMSDLLIMRRTARRHLRSAGMMEGMSLSFVTLADMDKLLLDPAHHFRRLVAIDNPLSSEWTHMRPSIIPNLLNAAKRMDDAMVFEIGAVFETDGERIVERWKASGILTETMRSGIWSGRAGKRDFYDVKGIVESLLECLGYANAGFTPSCHPFYYPKRQADVVIDGAVVGHLGQIHPETLAACDAGQELYIFEMDLTTLSAIPAPHRSYMGMPKFPSMKRDIAVVVSESVTARKIADSIRTRGGQIIREVTPFDIFRGEKIGPGKKSVAFSMEFRSDDKTLTDAEADEIFNSVLAGLKEDCGAELR